MGQVGNQSFLAQMVDHNVLNTFCNQNANLQPLQVRQLDSMLFSLAPFVLLSPCAQYCALLSRWLRKTDITQFMCYWR